MTLDGSVSGHVLGICFEEKQYREMRKKMKMRVAVSCFLFLVLTEKYSAGRYDLN